MTSQNLRSSYSAHRPMLIGIDGRSGSGKTVLTQRLVEALESRGHTVSVVRVDFMYQGWDGLREGLDIYTGKVLPALAAGQSVSWHPWDWNKSAGEQGSVEPVVNQPTEVIICEGVGVGVREARDYLDVLIWLRAPGEVRFRRAMDRDGEHYQAHWEQWAKQEQDLLNEDQIYDAADLVLVADHPDERHHTSARSLVETRLGHLD